VVGLGHKAVKHGTLIADFRTLRMHQTVINEGVSCRRDGSLRRQPQVLPW
jgi:hypothetical protein